MFLAKLFTVLATLSIDYNYLLSFRKPERALETQFLWVGFRKKVDFKSHLMAELKLKIPEI